MSNAVTLTPSSAAYLSCLKKFDVLAVQKRWPGVKSISPPLRFGMALHEVLRHLYDPAAGTPPHVDRLDLFIRAAFLRQPYADESDRQHDQDRARRLLCIYLSQDEDAAFTIAVERSGKFPVKVGGEVLYNISARLDRILVRDYDPETLVVRDYKLGQRALETEQIWINLACAKRMYPDFKQYVLEIDALTDDGIERVCYRSAALKGVVELVNFKVRRYLDAEEPCAEPGEACLHCPLLSVCQHQEAVDAADLDF